MAKRVKANATARFEEPPISFDSAKWFCITTNPNCQVRAELHLYSLGFRTFVPKVRKWVSHARVKKAVERPLLGRYIFVEVDYPRQSFGAVRAANGVESIISTMGVPCAFPAHWVEGLMRRHLSGEWDMIKGGPIPAGARVKIIEGEFDELLATVTNVSGRRVDVKLLDQNKYTRLNISSVRAA